jgi:hypothetical protein|nr:MAG TPA: Protein of unknown function (DUF2774) [Caudoviricetes sp.]
MEENLKSKILEDHANGMTLADISSKYDVSANELVNMILDNGVHNSGPRTFQEGPAFVVKDDTTSNTEVQEQEPSDIVLSIIPTDQESIPQHYMPTHNDVFMDLIIFGVSLDDVCSKYDITKGDVGIMLEEIYKDLSDRVIPMDDIKEAIKKICAEVYLARFN